LKKIGTVFFIAVLSIALISCVGKNSVTLQETPKEAVEDTPPIFTNGDGNMTSKNSGNQILARINKDMIERLKTLLYQELNLEEMEKEYGPIMEITWDEGAYYKHEKLILWISYYYSGTFVVDFSEESLITKRLGEVETYSIDYSIAGPYVILEDAKDAFIFGSKCELSELFNEADSLRIDDFEPFAVIRESELWLSKVIEFDYEGLCFGIISTDNTLHPESVVFIKSSV